jgi:hypothetical protein
MARGRKPGFQMGAEHRGKIQNSNILSALIEHAEGTREMAATQVTAALGLLRKVMPDLAAVQHSGEMTIKRAADLTDDALANIAAGSGDRASEETPSKALLN